MQFLYVMLKKIFLFSFASCMIFFVSDFCQFLRPHWANLLDNLILKGHTNRAENRN